VFADLPSYQFAYRDLSSSTIALIDMHDKITNSLEKSEIMGVMLIGFDFKNAFGNIPHAKMIEKLISLNYPEKFIQWIDSYLKNRTQCVKINNIKSDFIDITGGLPQGSVIAPFLFMLYLSSYKPRYTTSYPVIFADDIHLIIEMTKNINNESIICDEINNMKIWSESNYLPLNDDKMKLIYFGKNGLNLIFSQNHLS
jgi:hypothetical protein